MELSKEQIEQLKFPLPSEAVTQHPTKTYLSSIKAIYVVERLNEVFGIGKWRLTSEVIDNKTDMIVVQAKLRIPDYDIELESYGGNNNGGENSKNFDLGDAYKGATTDALTKICSMLEIGMDVFKGVQTGKPSTYAQKPHQEQTNDSQTGLTAEDEFKMGLVNDNIEDGKLGNCSKCGAPNKWSIKAGKPYCSKKCWLNITI